MSGFSGERMSQSEDVTAGSDEGLLSGDSRGMQSYGVIRTCITILEWIHLFFWLIHWLQLTWVNADIISVPYSCLATVWHCVNDAAHDKTEGNSSKQLFATDSTDKINGPYWGRDVI